MLAIQYTRQLYAKRHTEATQALGAMQGNGQELQHLPSDKI